MVTVQDLPRHGVLASITDGQFLAALAAAPEPLSRAEIAEQTGISKPAISEAAKRLSDHGIISTTGIRKAGRGGVATLFEINGQRAHSIALALAPSKIAVRATGVNGRQVFEAEHELGLESAPEEVIATAKAQLAEASKAADSPLEAVCVSVANPVDPRTGDTVSLANSAFAAGRFNVVQELEILAPSVVVDNDVNWATLAERHLGAMAGEDNFVYIYLGDGLGAGLFLGGALQRGHRGLAGEIGYLRDLDGMDLTQGLAAHGFGRGTSYGLDSKAATGTSSLPKGEVELAMQRVAHHVANIVTLLNPRAVVLGGPLTRQEAIPQLIEKHIAQLIVSPVEVVIGNFAPLDGAGFEAHRLARLSFGF